jgi:hypothetical protein
MLNAGGTPSIQSGTLAARPAFGDTGAIYITSDTNVIYRDTGTAWVAVSPPSVASFNYGTVAYQSGTTLIPADNTTPLSTEGTQLFTLTVTPASTASKFRIDFSSIVDSGSNNRYITLAAFRGTTCIYAGSSFITTATRFNTLTIHVVDIPAVTTATTYSVRIGISSAATWYVAGSPNITYGGAGSAEWSIVEYA